VSTPDALRDSLLRQAIALAASARAHGNHPFGALLAIGDRVLLTAENAVVTGRDATAHAEMRLVQLAVRQLSPPEVIEATLYTSCEPCAMCSGAMYWAGIRSIVYALSSERLAQLAGEDFLMPCRALFAHALKPVHVVGPLLDEEGVAVHVGFWPPPPQVLHGSSAG
jgi:tRNA(Arg) A34 adenosine deaminase TadA